MTNSAKPPRVVAQLPPTTPLQNVSRSPQEIAAHRAQTSALVEVFLDGYWQSDMSQAKRNLALTDWCDELEDWPVDSIKTAFRQWRRDNPNKKPNPGHILEILKRAWWEYNAEQTQAAAQRLQPQEPRSIPTLAERQALGAELAAMYPRLIKRIPPVEE